MLLETARSFARFIPDTVTSRWYLQFVSAETVLEGRSNPNDNEKTNRIRSRILLSLCGNCNSITRFDRAIASVDLQVLISVPRGTVNLLLPSDCYPSLVPPWSMAISLGARENTETDRTVRSFLTI